MCLRSTGGLIAVVNRRLRAQWSISLTGPDNNVVVRNGKEGMLRIHRSVLYKFSITSPRQDVFDTLFASPSKVCNTPPLGVSKNVLTSVRA